MNSGIEAINGSAYKYYEAVLPQFNNICDPLFKLGIRYFGYMRIFKDGSYLSLINHPSFKRTYLSTIKDQGPFFREFNVLGESKSRYSLLGNDINSYTKKTDPILHLLYDFNIWNIMTIHKLRKEHFVECYSFCMPPEETNSAQFYLENLTLLEHFTGYFNEKAKDIIDCKNKDKLAMFEQQLILSNKSEIDLLAQKVEQFLVDTKLDRLSLKIKGEDIPLTKREGDCLQYLAEHKSAKEIGKILEISPRTVEGHLLNIKGKAGVTKNSELVAQFLNK